MENPGRVVLPPQIKAVIRSFLENGGGSFPSPYEAYRIETEVAETGVTLDFFKEDEPIAICVGTWSAEFAREYWGDIEMEYYNLTDVVPQLASAENRPEIPETVPWLATLLLPGFFTKVNSDSPDVSFLNMCEFVFFETAHELA